MDLPEDGWKVGPDPSGRSYTYPYFVEFRYYNELPIQDFLFGIFKTISIEGKLQATTADISRMLWNGLSGTLEFKRLESWVRFTFHDDNVVRLLV